MKYRNLIYLSTSILPSKAANSIHVMKMCDHFANYFENVILFARANKKGDKEHIHQYYGCKNNFKVELYCPKIKIGSSIRIIRKIFYELLNYDKENTLIYGRSLEAVYLSSILGFNCFYESHSINKSIVKNILEWRLLRSDRLIRLIIISRALKNLYDKKYLCSPRYMVLYDAADVPENNDTISYEWPSKRKTIQVGYIGHLYKGRGIDIIINCAKLIPEYDFHIVGGEISDVNYWKNNSYSNVYFHGFVEPYYTSLIRSKCDILLMPYQRKVSVANKSDTSAWMSPLKLAEYMSSRRPIISSNLNVLNEILNIDNSILVEPDDVEAWKSAILELGSNKEKRETISNNAYNYFLSHLKWDQRIKKIIEMVE